MVAVGDCSEVGEDGQADHVRGSADAFEEVGLVAVDAVRGGRVDDEGVVGVGAGDGAVALDGVEVLVAAVEVRGEAVGGPDEQVDCVLGEAAGEVRGFGSLQQDRGEVHVMLGWSGHMGDPHGSVFEVVGMEGMSDGQHDETELAGGDAHAVDGGWEPAGDDAAEV